MQKKLFIEHYLFYQFPNWQWLQMNGSLGLIEMPDVYNIL